MRTIEYKGVPVAYDERCMKSYRWQKAVNSGDSGRTTRAIARLFCDRDEYYAYAIGVDEPMSYEDWLKQGDDLLDDSMEAMGELLGAIMEDMGQTAKN